MELSFVHGKCFHVQIGLRELPKERVVKISIVLVFHMKGNTVFFFFHCLAFTITERNPFEPP